jgi:putative two-component system response regulator
MKILAVDDNAMDLSLLQKMLQRQEYEVLTAPDGKTALCILEKEEVDLLILDIVLPDISGFEVAKRVKKGSRIPIILLSGMQPEDYMIDGLQAGADEFICKPFLEKELILRIRNILKTKDYQNRLEETVTRRSSDLKKALKKSYQLNREMVFRLLVAAECRDDSTGRHIVRVGKYSSIIARNLGLSDDFLELIENAAPMHDIGKVGIPDNILLKPGKLSTDEFEIMKTHTTLGADILKESRFTLLKMSYDIALSHHERWNGKGYPHGRQEDSIPIAARITAVSDVFDALTSKRPYKPAYSWERSIEIIREEKGQHFDPRIVDAFFSALPDIQDVYRTCRDPNSTNDDEGPENAAIRA